MPQACGAVAVVSDSWQLLAVRLAWAQAWDWVCRGRKWVLKDRYQPCRQGGEKARGRSRSAGAHCATTWDKKLTFRDWLHDGSCW